MGWRFSWRLLLVALLLLVCGGWSYLAYRINAYAELDETRTADAAIVLGAGVVRGRPSNVFRERINHSVMLYHAGYVDYLIFTGGIGTRDEQSEAAVARSYAMAQGVPAAAILIEESSTNTVENLRHAQGIAQAHDLHTFLIVSTPFHMKRALSIAYDLGIEAYSSPTRTIRWINNVTKLRALMQETVSYIRYLVVGSES